MQVLPPTLLASPETVVLKIKYEQLYKLKKCLVLIKTCNKPQIHDVSLQSVFFHLSACILSSYNEAMKINSIFLLTSTTSSHTIKMHAPNFLAIEMAYFAFQQRSSSVSPAVTKSQSTMRGSIEAQSLIRKRPSFSDLSEKLVIQ